MAKIAEVAQDVLQTPYALARAGAAFIALPHPLKGLSKLTGAEDGRAVPLKCVEVASTQVT